MNNNKAFAMKALNTSLDSNLNLTTNGTGFQWAQLSGTTETPKPLTALHYWQEYYYPWVIKESYPIYLQERAQDKGKQAFEIIKVLKDKKLVNLSKVSNFIDLMDELIKIL